LLQRNHYGVPVTMQELLCIMKDVEDIELKLEMDEIMRSVETIMKRVETVLLPKPETADRAEE
jgi:hypothetical protein